ncbi:MAG: hypothetical protein QM756_12765 [Polyangiaceae bacterium]
MRLRLVSGLFVAFIACSGEKTSGPNDSVGGGVATSGGTTSLGGSGNIAGAAAGGSANAGGASGLGGSNAGGAVGTAGATPAGGAVTAGGAVSAGGVASGGSTVSVGGATAGGAVGTGGNASTGGAAGTGGALSSGGSASMGGAGTGGTTSASGGATACGQCTAYSAPTQSGSVEPNDLSALSGLAMSRTQTDIVFVHNDHQTVLVFALDLAGKEHARITGQNVTATDIEDIAVGPCGAQTCVYLADIGDNNAQRTEYAILRFVAPTVPATAGSMAINVAMDRFRFTYPDGSHNAESLMVGPDGTVYVISKLAPGSGGNVLATGPSSIYRLPLALSTTTVASATKVVTLPVPRTGEGAASAAAAHPCGTGFLLRTYDRVFEFLAPSGMGFEASFNATPREIAMGSEPQSEGIDYRAGGRGFVTSGEGSHAPIMTTTCAQ